MPEEKIDAIHSEIEAAVDLAGTIATVISPQYSAFIVLGQALAKSMPDLYDDVIRMLSKSEPDQAAIESLAAKIEALSHPEDI